MTVLANIDVVILAGGLGTRLRSVLPDRQKVAADVGGRPFILYLLDWLARYGARRVVLAAGHGAHDLERFTLDHGHRNLTVVLSKEETPLGTGGALRFAQPHITSPTVLVMNGDSFVAADLPALIASHRARNALATLTLVPMDDASRYGLVEMGLNGGIVRFVEKPADSSTSPVSGYINAGLYLFERALVEAIAPGRQISLERDVFPGYYNKGLFGVVQDCPFIDIGTPESLREAESFIKRLSNHERDA